MRRTRLLTLPLLAVLPALPACNDGTSGDGPTVAATPAEVHDFCDAQCARSARCGTTEPAVADAGDSCADGCVTELGSLGSNLRADVVRELAACQASLPCGPSDDDCLTTAIEATGQSIDAAIHADDVQACLRKQAECNETAGDFSDDLCGTLPALVQEARTRAARCFEGACDDMAACLAPIFGT